MDTSTAVAKPELSMIMKSYHNKAISKTANANSKESTFDSLFTKQTKDDNPKVDVKNNRQDKISSSHDANKVKKSIQTDGNTNETVSNDAKDQLEIISSNVLEKLKDILDLSEEELNDLMEQIGITMFDLVDPSQLLKLILAANSETDPEMLLTDESMGSQFKELMDCFNQIKDQYSMSTEDLKNLLSQVKKEMSTEIQSKEENITDFTLQKSDDGNVQSMEQTNNELDNKDNVTISVVKEESQSLEKNTDSKESFSDQRSDKKADFTNQLIEHMVNATTSTEPLDFNSRLAQIHETKSMVSQIVEQIKIHIRPDQTSMEFTLNPESLGKIALNVTSRNGVLTASFLTQNQATKEAIESQMQTLKDNFNEQGLKVDAIEVTVSEFGFSQDEQMGQKGEHKNQSFTKEKKVFRMDAGLNATEDTITEESKPDHSIHMGSQIDYSA